MSMPDQTGDRAVGVPLLRRRGTMAVFFLLWAAWLAIPYLGLGPHSYVRIHDNADSTLALRVSLRSEAPPHLASAWNPMPLGGLDQGPLINCGTDIDGWLFAFLPGWLAYGVIMFAQRFIAGYFTWRLARDRLCLSMTVSLCAGVAYAVFSQNTINVDWAGPTLYDGLSLACLPLALWALDDTSGWSLRRRVCVATGLGLLLGLTSHYSGAVFVVIAVVAWVLLRRRGPARQAALVALALALGWLVAEAPAIWSSMLTSPLSNRADWGNRSMSLGAALSRQFSYVRGIVQDNYVMVGAAILGLAATRLRDRRLLVAFGATAATVLIVLGSGVWLMGYRRYAGPLSGFQIDRFYLLIPFALIMFGALGLHAVEGRLRRRVPEGKRRSRLLAVGLTLLALLVLGPLTTARVQLRIAREMRAGSTYAAVYERPELRRLAAEDGASAYRVATVYAPQAFSEAPDSYWPFLFGPLPAFAWAYGFETVDGYVQMYPERYQRFWGAVVAPALARDEAMSDYFWEWGNRVYLFVPGAEEELAAPTSLGEICDRDLLSLANVRYLISPVRLGGSDLVLISEDDGNEPWPLFVYENTRVLPRYFLASSVRAYPDSSSVIEALGRATLDELSSIAYMESGDTGGVHVAQASGREGRVEPLATGADAVSLTVSTPESQLLVCTISYSPHWRAYVDGREVRVLPADATFMGVAIPAGKHRVELRYKPAYAWLLPG